MKALAKKPFHLFPCPRPLKKNPWGSAPNPLYQIIK